MSWFVYMILCSDESLYTGISNDVQKRYRQHFARQGAKYFRGRSPQRLIYVESGHDHSSAARREAVIKKLSRQNKLQLIESRLNEALRFSC
ncbi:MAG: GIY-YIG nuclease family protein [Gammaproteobacteria bacterium HGW-Gammaproteobacteria-3]|jgi:putative endonuclease|nr:MAG: GIY-YIG nuclease family protein [Gammaproteobacteria bacterium HGW-Gammaproteobacteria-3]